MVFASPIFLALFLPATIACYFVAPRAWRNGALMAASLAFYAWGEAAYVPLVLALRARELGARARDRPGAPPDARARPDSPSRVAGEPLGPRGVQVRELRRRQRQRAALAALGIAPIALAPVPLPLGISFFTFHAISYVVDVYKRNASACRRPARLRALHPRLPPAHRRADHPLARHRRAARLARANGSPTSRTARAGSCSASARRCWSPIRWARSPTASSRCRRRRADHAARLARTRLLHAADLLRLLRLLRHGDRPDAHVRLPHPRELQLPVRRAQRARVLAALAHLAVELVPRLPLHPARRQSRRRASARTATSRSCSCSAACGMARAGRSCSGARGTAPS